MKPGAAAAALLLAGVLAAPAVRAADPAATAGELTVNARPWAQVWIDGKMVKQETPLFRAPIALGKHVLKVTNPTLKLSVSRTIHVHQGEPLELFADLKAGVITDREPDDTIPNSGYVSVDVPSSWAQIFVDGKDTGRLTPSFDLQLPAGRHEIMVLNPVKRLRGTATVEIVAGKWIHSVVEMKPMPQ